jgi:hypothetical protein
VEIISILRHYLITAFVLRMQLHLRVHLRLHEDLALDQAKNLSSGHPSKQSRIVKKRQPQVREIMEEPSGKLEAEVREIMEEPSGKLEADSAAIAARRGRS